jgi:putative ATP-dependent endonuclease of the OLD family
MYISYIKIKNYRSIKVDQFEASPFTCAIGENNAGKSSILLATSLFFSGTALSRSDYYNDEEEIEIDITFSDIKDGDVNRLSPEHRARINEIVENGTLVLTRLYHIDGKSELLCRRLSPRDMRFGKSVVSEMMKGKKGKEIGTSVTALFPEYEQQLGMLTTQKDVFQKLDELAASLPEEEMELKLAPLPTGIDNSITKLLPEPIYIAAVKDLKDDVKSKESATFGKLLGILMRFLETSVHFDAISKSFNDLHALLNVVRDSEGVSDNRIEKLQVIEGQIGKFLSENFPKSKIEIEISKPELKQIFANAKILIDDGVKDIIETKGDGIKRAVTFALLRTYVEQLKEQKKLSKGKEVEEAVEQPTEDLVDQPYVFLFEEPELYLHPNAQKILFEALENLTTENNQVFVTTHSPMFFSPRSTGTFIKVIKKYPTTGKPFAKFYAVNLLKEVQAKDAFQIICYENNTAAFFSDKVLLVEGDSDLIYIKEVSRLINSDWSFDNKNIPIISINGKSNIKRFVQFYNFFQIQCYCIVDSDALIDGFEKFDVSDDIKAQRSALLATIDKIAIEYNIEADLKREKIKEIVRRYSWRDSYDRLKLIANKIRRAETVSTEELTEIEFLFAEEENNKRRQVFTAKDISVDGKEELLEALRAQNIFILSHGAIENYYPNGIEGDDKPTKALNAVKFLKTVENCKEHLPEIMVNQEARCELEVIFERIFNGTTETVVA